MESKRVFVRGSVVEFTPPKFNIFAPENGWLEDNPFLLGSGNFSGANC